MRAIAASMPMRSMVLMPLALTVSVTCRCKDGTQYRFGLQVRGEGSACFPVRVGVHGCRPRRVFPEFDMFWTCLQLYHNDNHYQIRKAVMIHPALQSQGNAEGARPWCCSPAPTAWSLDSVAFSSWSIPPVRMLGFMTCARTKPWNPVSISCATSRSPIAGWCSASPIRSGLRGAA